MTAALKKLMLFATAPLGAAAVACTSFAVHPGVSETGNMMLHKCRDRAVVGRLDANIRSGKDGVRWMHEFNGHQFYGPKDYDTPLKLLYGDYMQIPPKEKQITHKPLFVDLTRGYTKSEIDDLLKQMQ